jgi:glycosyltransferase involved in cell wall biosynthesis
MSIPDVSVIIPSFNRADLVGQAIRSAIEQPGCTVEVIVVDDGSTDGTREVLRASFADLLDDESVPAQQLLVSPQPGDKGFPVVRYRRQANAGMSAANNTGLNLSAGEFVKFLDSDDELLPKTLARELAAAREQRVDVLCTGFEQRFVVDGIEQSHRRSFAPAPRLDRGIDDMLTGQAPWTAAALYRRELVQPLRWPLHIRFGNDWAWAWTVCLAGARFASLDIRSAVYNHHDRGQMTTASDGFEKSIVARQQILDMVYRSLSEQRLLTSARRQALAQYFYKDALTLYERDARQLDELARRCEELVPGFRPVVYNPRLSPFVSLLGPYRGAAAYVRLKRVVMGSAFLLQPARWLLRKARRDYPVGG